MMKHKHAELIKAWADNTDIKFKKDGLPMLTFDIHSLIDNPYGDWQIVKEPVVKVKYYVSSKNGEFSRIYDQEYFNNWQMKITITDGDIANAKVELR